MTFEYSQETINDYEKLFETEEGYDVIIYVGENEILKEFHVHSFILRARSQYFNTTFSNKWIEKENGKFIFKKPNITPQSFEIILRFIYCGKVDLTKLKGSELLKCLMIATEFNIHALISCIQKRIIDNNEDDDFLIEIFQIVYQHESFEYLRNYCFQKAKMIISSDKFISFEEPLVEFLLKCNDLNINEIEIWENLIKWGLAKEQALDQDVSKWSQDDISTFKMTLYKFIPLIKFYEISSKDYFEKVKPYEEILPKELREDILKFHMVPEYKPIYTPRFSKYVVDSTIINQRHVATFAYLISQGSTNYKFKLLYRASRDGYTIEEFHKKCNNKGPTIVVIKIGNSEQIVGGYDPCGKQHHLNSSTGSFIFTFTDRKNLQTMKLGYLDRPYNTTMTVNNSAFGRDLIQSYNCTWYYSNADYQNINLPVGYLNGEDCEVFQICKEDDNHTLHRRLRKWFFKK